MLVERIGARTAEVRDQVLSALEGAARKPPVGVLPHWYFQIVIEYLRGDILEADAEALVNTVNCVGVMGRGIALQFKNACPANFNAYAAACLATRPKSAACPWIGAR